MQGRTPITKELLEANGFEYFNRKCENYNEYFLYSEGWNALHGEEDIILTIYPILNGFWGLEIINHSDYALVEVSVKYAEELQMALDLCRIEKKIETSNHILNVPTSCNL
jgi:hypothetical protein